jgi:hypothetical protein
MCGGFLRQQLFLRRHDHRPSQPAIGVFGFDNGKLRSAGWGGRAMATGVLKHEFQTIGNEILERSALQGRVRLGPSEKVVRKLNSGSHESILAYSCFGARVVRRLRGFSFK